MLHSRIGQATRQTWGRDQPDGDSGTPRAIRPECLTRSSVRRLYTIQGGVVAIDGQCRALARNGVLRNSSWVQSPHN